MQVLSGVDGLATRLCAAPQPPHRHGYPQCTDSYRPSSSTTRREVFSGRFHHYLTPTVELPGKKNERSKPLTQQDFVGGTATLHHRHMSPDQKPIHTDISSTRAGRVRSHLGKASKTRHNFSGRNSSDQGIQSPLKGIHSTGIYISVTARGFVTSPTPVEGSRCMGGGRERTFPELDRSLPDSLRWQLDFLLHMLISLLR